MKISPDRSAPIPPPRPLATYTVRELRQIVRTVARLSASLTIADTSVHLQQVRFFPAPAYTLGEPHSHSCFEGILVLDGAVAYALEDTRVLQVGDACLFPPTVRHAWQTDAAPCLRLVCWFTCARPERWHAATLASCPEVLDDVQLLAHEVHARPPGWQVRVPLRLATVLARWMTLTDTSAAPTCSATADDALLMTIDQFVRDNLREPLRLATIATHLGMSERSLVRAYRRLTGRTLWSAVQQFRLEHAADLLIDTDLSITDIADRVGMPDVAYFCARFHRYTQITPRQYRRQARTEPCRHEEPMPSSSPQACERRH
jgi:AraC-like DNA-binding protein/quercetin dioxygenase-like cupin family protein